MDHDDETMNDLVFGQASYSVMWISAGTECLVDAFTTEEEAVAWAQEEHDSDGGTYQIRKHTIAVVKVIGEV